MSDSLDRALPAASDDPLAPRGTPGPGLTHKQRALALLRAEGGPLLFVWIVWLVYCISLVQFVARFGVDIPRLDEWEMVRAITGEQAITPSWLWSQHNEHRIVMPRLLFMLVTKLSGNSFRAGMFLDALLLTISAAALLLAARALRGRTSYTDAFLALSVLHLGQVENLLWSFQIQFVGSSVLMMGALAAIALPGPVRERAAIWVGVSAVMLPLFGGNGLALVPALALCTLSLAWELRRARPSERAWRLVGGLGLFSIALTGLYFIGYQRPPEHPVSPGLSATLLATRQILSYALGSGMRGGWPVNQYLVPILVTVTLVALLFRLWHVRADVGELLRTLRFGLVIGGLLTLVVGIAWARIGVYPDGVFASRYATLGAPLMCALYLSWLLLASHLPALDARANLDLSRLAQMTLFFIAAMFALKNRDSGLREGNRWKVEREAALVAVIKGVPLSQIAVEHCGTLYICDEPTLLERMRLLHEKKIGDWSRANPR